MDDPILIIGSEGLIGWALHKPLAVRGTEVGGLNLRASCGEAGDMRDSVAGCSGIVHLGAVPRVG